MSARIWNKNLPPNFYLGSAFSPSQGKRNLLTGWTIQHNPDGSADLSIRPIFDQKSSHFRFYPRIKTRDEIGNLGQIDPLKPVIKRFSWDWLEIASSSQNGLETNILFWIPEDDAICAEITIDNQGDQTWSGVLEFVGDIYSLSTQSKIDYGEYIGRPIITCRQDNESFTLLITGNPQPGTGPERYLENQISLKSAEKISFRWICRCSPKESPGYDRLDYLLGLDWQGELSKRTIRDQGTIQISTGDLDRDFILALSQKEGNRIANYLLKELHWKSKLKITPLQALYFIQSLDQLSPEITNQLLNTVYQPEIISENKTTPPLFGIELIWQLNQRGIQKEVWFPYLAIALQWLEDWFSPGIDRDGDSIPELIHPDLLGIYLGEEDVLSKGQDFILPYPYIESPGLAAILFNELSKLTDLDPLTNTTLQNAKDALLLYIEDSWDSEKKGYQYRDSWSHTRVKRELISENLRPGLNILRTNLSLPSRIGILTSRNNPTDTDTSSLEIHIHGLDLKGNYRIETIEGSDQYTYGLSEGIFQRIDYCVVDETQDIHGLSLHAAGTNRDDLTLALPFWADATNPDHAQDLVDMVLLNTERFLTPFGLRSLPNSISHSIQMSWNLLFGQALVRSGRRNAAWMLFSRWLITTQIAQDQAGNFFSAYDGRTGRGLELGDPVDRILPVYFFLELAGIYLMQDGTGEIRDEYTLPFPIQIKFKGTEIYRDSESTKLRQPTGDVVEYSVDDPVNFIWDYESSENFST